MENFFIYIYQVFIPQRRYRKYSQRGESLGQDSPFTFYWLVCFKKWFKFFDTMVYFFKSVPLSTSLFRTGMCLIETYFIPYFALAAYVRIDTSIKKSNTFYLMIVEEMLNILAIIIICQVTDRLIFNMLFWFSVLFLCIREFSVSLLIVSIYSVSCKKKSII